MMHAVALAGVIQQQLGVTTVQRLQTNLENFSFLGFGSVRILIRQGGPCVSLHFAPALGKQRLQSRVRGPGDAFFSRIEPKEYGRDIPRKKRGDGRIVDRQRHKHGESESVTSHACQCVSCGVRTDHCRALGLKP